MRTAIIVLVIALAGAAGPARADPTVCDAVWTDPARDRAVPVRVRLPATTSATPAATPAPVVVFSHGLGGTLDAGTDWAGHWASVGIATIHVQHPGSDAGSWRSVKPGARRDALRAAASGDQLSARVADVRFLLDELARRRGDTMAGGCRLDRLALDRVGMAGHSFGAVTTQALAGQRFADGATGKEPRIVAAIAFSPSPARQLPDPVSFGAIAIPFLSVTGTADVVPALDRASAQDRTRPFTAMPPGAKYLLVLDGADQAIFNGHRLRRGEQPDDARIRRAVRDVTTLFWTAHLLGDRQAATALGGPAGRQTLSPVDRLVAR